MELIYGRPVADKILSGVKEEIIQSGIVPGLAVILIGNDPASHLYVRL
ncbi:MAG: tetrahydrofolate dehydrogenase/cyclohydrolase catalytic domain-containing protein, partial [Parcubacteria group bacterium]